MCIRIYIYIYTHYVHTYTYHSTNTTGEGLRRARRADEAQGTSVQGGAAIIIIFYDYHYY